MKKIQVLGDGCANCDRLEEAARRVADEMGIECEIVKVTDIAEILASGVMATPAMIVDGELKVTGRVPSPAEIKEMIG